jgi:hypothetical protein
VKVVIGAADINFELWFDGEKISKDNPIKVEWFATTHSPPAAIDGNDIALSAPAISRSRKFGDSSRKLARDSIAMMSNLSLSSNGSGWKSPNFASLGQRV